MRECPSDQLEIAAERRTMQRLKKSSDGKLFMGKNVLKLKKKFEKTQKRRSFDKRIASLAIFYFFSNYFHCCSNIAIDFNLESKTQSSSKVSLTHAIHFFSAHFSSSQREIKKSQ